MIKNIIWTVDGVLFNTYPAITYAISKSLNELGFSIALNVIDALARQSLNHCLETLSQRFGLDPELLYDHYAKSYRKVSPTNQLPFPGVRAVCEWVCAQGGVNVIVSNHDLQSTLTLLNTYGLPQLFKDISSLSQEYSQQSYLTIIRTMLDKHELNPNETLLVSNSKLDMQTGRAAGVLTCLYGKAEQPQLADYQIDDYDQLMKHLKTSVRKE